MAVLAAVAVFMLQTAVARFHRAAAVVVSLVQGLLVVLLAVAQTEMQVLRVQHRVAVAVAAGARTVAQGAVAAMALVALQLQQPIQLLLQITELFTGVRRNAS
ncbi:hypothetical protein [Stenotrophomonas sp.]|uniref:hypothetical protein n=1 Tax=Stenotrophomonas sp. TaxID=69392 RepID=UPI003C3C2A20